MMEANLSERVERESKFKGLPEGIQHQFYHSALVHMWVTAYLFGKIDCESMLAELASALALQNAETTKQLVKFTEWFGAPIQIVCPTIHQSQK